MTDASRAGRYTTNMTNGTSANGTLCTKSTDTSGDDQIGSKESAAVDTDYGVAGTRPLGSEPTVTPAQAGAAWL
ncbi:hypothetical protein [Saccharothrix sp. ST-888]|uniref:hypothetical protein n=1 Tax=Saccharothrix sp. ST-888 TaxID=1427391 RepID=UPI003FA6FADE